VSSRKRAGLVVLAKEPWESNRVGDTKPLSETLQILTVRALGADHFEPRIRQFLPHLRESLNQEVDSLDRVKLAEIQDQR
jgi:hypothetical protein